MIEFFHAILQTVFGTVAISCAMLTADIPHLPGTVDRPVTYACAVDVGTDRYIAEGKFYKFDANKSKAEEVEKGDTL